jgi:hypothetical protein
MSASSPPSIVNNNVPVLSAVIGRVDIPILRHRHPDNEFSRNEPSPAMQYRVP